MSDPALFEKLFAPVGWQRRSGKVREAFWGEDQGVIITTDRVSAFDAVLGEIPGKGAILNQLSQFWFDATSDVLPNHILQKLGPRSSLVRRCEVLPVEVIVRAYLTGSAWRAVAAGQIVPGMPVGDGPSDSAGQSAGIREFHRFETPCITPSTKAEIGDHDEPISREDIIARGLVSAEVWQQVERAALALFARGSEFAQRQGLVLVDTKYEFGLYQGRLYLVDEVHTPDSSRYWYANNLNDDGTVPAGLTPRQLDKEFLRNFLRETGFTGDGPVPELPQSVKEEVAARYRELYEQVTGQGFARDVIPLEEELELVARWMQTQD
ncbi:MAG: phosphoribosylaminoimidazolesuccinocarboxamide synthase [Spirochaetaceae bacterium]|nr:MAG: phosphoribosylaminoimidazolesuccinocarboxamide synthase [Spirochaetaceae bacterium]